MDMKDPCAAAGMASAPLVCKILCNGVSSHCTAHLKHSFHAGTVSSSLPHFTSIEALNGDCEAISQIFQSASSAVTCVTKSDNAQNADAISHRTW